MKLRRFKVTNYRSIEDSDWVELDNIAVIVGKNEAGKTSLLKALWKFNPFDEHPYNLDREWPKGRRKERSDDKIVIETEFTFDDVERATLASIHESAVAVTGVRITRNYRGNYFYTFLPEQPDQKRDVEWVVSVLEEHFGTVPEGASDHFRTQCDILFKTFVEETRAKNGTDFAIVQAATFKSQIAQHPQYGQDNRILQTIQKQVDVAVEKIKTDTPIRRAIDIAHKWLPTFIYMDDYRIFTGEAQLDEVQQRFVNKRQTDADYTIKLIMEQAGLNLDEEVKKGNNEDRQQRILDMNDASITLTNEIEDRWSQKKYEIRFQADGQHFVTFVKDANGKSLVPLEERSKGFQWFFSFDMLFMCETAGKFKNAVILLDEPGLHLHASAQRDLLVRMKAYAAANQLIYSTHLPFMIDFTQLDNIYVCEERDGEGVKVHQNWAIADKDARFTLQAALGLSWSQSLFVGQFNLVVEGITDFWFLMTISEMLRHAGEAGLDEQLVVTPAGGASKVAYVGTLLRGQELHVAVLLDSDPEGKSAYEQLVHSWVMDDKHVLMLGPILGAKGSRCIEDLFDEDYYVKQVRESYKSELAGKTLNVPAADDRTIVQRVEHALQAAGIEKFNKGRPAKIIMKDLATSEAKSLPKGTLDRFRKVVVAVNSIVQTWRTGTAK